MTQWLLVDLYGTLVEVDWHAVRARVVSRMHEVTGGTPGTSGRALQGAIRHAAPERLMGAFPDANAEWQAICSTAGLPQPGLAQELAAAESAAIRETWQPRAVGMQVLEMVRAQGWDRALVTNCYRSTAQLVREGAVEIPAEEFFFSCELGVAKPDPAFLERVLRGLQVAPRACLYLDDLSENCDVAQQLGMSAVQATWTGEHEVRAVGLELARRRGMR